MVTIFQNRKLVRAEIAAFFLANGAWQEVYDHTPDVSEFLGKTPIFFVTSDGRESKSSGVSNNPQRYRFLLVTCVLRKSKSDNYTADDAEDILDDLDLITAQIFRTEAGNFDTADIVQLEPSFSQIATRVFDGGFTYKVETRAAIATLSSGAV